MGGRSLRSSLILLLAAVTAGLGSISGTARTAAPPISIAIPAPFERSEPGPAATCRWLRRTRPLGAGAPAWAGQLYSRSLLVLGALTDPGTGAMIAGAREGWAYVWPRDAAAGALALAASGHELQARRVVDFLLGLDLDAAARFEADADPVPGRPAAGDARGWVAAAARAVGMAAPSGGDWRGRQDYGENLEDDLLGNAIAAGAPAGEVLGLFATRRGLTREAGGTALDSAAAWAVAPFRRPALIPASRLTLLSLAASSTRFGIAPTGDWTRGEAWTAPTAWSAWVLAELGEHAAADRLLRALHRAATPAGTLPERVSALDGRPLSVTPLGWSHAFAVLALRARYPPGSRA